MAVYTSSQKGCELAGVPVLVEPCYATLPCHRDFTSCWKEQKSDLVGTLPGMAIGKVLSLLAAMELQRLSSEVQERCQWGSLLPWLQRSGDNSCWLKRCRGDLGEASKLQGEGLSDGRRADQVPSPSGQMLANLSICRSSVNFPLTALDWRSVTMIKSTYWITVILIVMLLVVVNAGIHHGLFLSLKPDLLSWSEQHEYFLIP